MNKKAASILGVGLMIAFGMVLLALIVHTATEYIAFDRFAGDDATKLSALKYESYAIQFFVDRTTDILATELLKNESLPEYYAYLAAANKVYVEDDYYVVVDDNKSFSALRDIDSTFPTWASEKFTTGFNEYAKAYTQKAPEDDLPRISTVNTYKLYWKDAQVTAIALHPQFVRNSSNMYYFWPHGTTRVDTASSFDVNPMRTILTTETLEPTRTEEEGNFTVLYYDGTVKLKARVEKQDT